ncbi:MAG: four-carbon acid sugar kinase family protein [Chloroflexota bacterium]
MLQLAIVADDLTGAMDTGVQFAKRGLRTVVGLADTLPAEAAGADVAVLNTNSRPDSPAEARRKVYACGRYLRDLGVPRVYKKIDSTLRGNVGVELDALMDAWEVPTVVVTPAFPAVGRTVVAGLLFVNGLPWEDTQYSEGTNVSTSYVADVLQSARRAGLVELAEIDQGAAVVAQRLRELVEAGTGLVVADAAKSEDLAVVGSALAQAGLDRVVCGSGGLAEELSSAFSLLGSGSEVFVTADTPARPVLVVAGTVNRVTLAQVRQAQQSLDADVVEVLPSSLSPATAAQTNPLSLAYQTALSNCHDLIVATVSLREQSEATMTARDSTVASALGPVVAAGLRPGDWAGMVLTGGDTAVGVLAALGVGALEILGEVEPGVPCGRLLEGPLAGLPVVTKAGGFGSPEAIANAVTFLRRRTSR